MFPVSTEIVEIPKSETFNQIFRKFRVERQMEQKFPVRNFQTFRWPRKVVIFSGNSGKCCSFRLWKFPDTPTGILLRVESGLLRVKIQRGPIPRVERVLGGKRREGNGPFFPRPRSSSAPFYDRPYRPRALNRLKQCCWLLQNLTVTVIRYSRQLIG